MGTGVVITLFVYLLALIFFKCVTCATGDDVMYWLDP